ncbi:MAG: NAD(P)/FAD-dependent oxidoreductase [Leptolyngbya sp. UWPOB_LEPTO1]|uniref:phytoene desaturase family protein n=1 Tax=Leptolyngbya sp. UWPOB_LEPTO1 TaxID=2815653 RepID=UPI001AD181C5|nr:NAD(P)/FAD-dependent oxidoreductase [Leptolyngbya sp. UWPOB_LEPTO1]MBN8563310.1 NAD(P)/FAD-dependent oxidoreductase [Leptolyngbya sp. UWPOB_LEPTO1]
MVDAIVIGSGIGGLSCAGILAKYGYDVLVCESHAIAGGAAHGFERNGFRFDSGPSLYSGMSYSPSPNPLRQVLDAIDEDIEWLNYDTWGCCLPEGTFDTQVGAEQFCEVLQQLRGENAVAEWKKLQQVMAPLAKAAIALPPAAVRYDFGALLSVGQYLPKMLQNAIGLSQITGAFSPVMDKVVSDPFIRNWMDLLCFLLSGLPADSTNAAEVAFMFADWYRPNVQLDYPKGGSGAIVDALVRGLKKFGGKIRLNAHVEKVLVENQKAVGVKLRNGEELRSRYVISNASIWDTLKLVNSSEFTQQRQDTPQCDSFMHLHLGIDGQSLDHLACHHIVVNDWSLGITAPQNVVLISIPSLLDRALAPPGKHAIHVYTPGNEPYEIWEKCDSYPELKQQRSEVMWKALERVIPDIRSRTELTLIGTPLTHERFLRRHRGTYGAAIRATDGLFPSALTPISGLLCCGDSTFPGIGLPAVAASGMIAANTIAPVRKHLDLLKQIQ